MILAAWTDGRVIWSNDRLNGGPPFRQGRIDPKRVTAELARFADGFFAKKEIWATGPGSDSIRLIAKTGKSRFQAAAWHELFEADGKLMMKSGSIATLDGEPRLQALRKEPSEWLFFRAVWNDARLRLASLVPESGEPCAGEAFMENGELFWRDAPAGNR